VGCRDCAVVRWTSVQTVVRASAHWVMLSVESGEWASHSPMRVTTTSSVVGCTQCWQNGESGVTLLCTVGLSRCDAVASLVLDELPHRCTYHSTSDDVCLVGVWHSVVWSPGGVWYRCIPVLHSLIMTRQG